MHLRETNLEYHMLLLRCRLLGGLSFKRVFIDCNFVLSHHQSHNPANGEDTSIPRDIGTSSSLHLFISSFFASQGKGQWLDYKSQAVGSKGTLVTLRASSFFIMPHKLFTSKRHKTHTFFSAAASMLPVQSAKRARTTSRTRRRETMEIHVLRESRRPLSTETRWPRVFTVLNEHAKNPFILRRPAETDRL